MKKTSKFLACSLAVTQLIFPLSSVFATSEKSENIKKQENTVLKYAKKAAVLPLKGAWWLTKANLKALAVLTADGVVLTSIAAYKLHKFFSNITSEEIVRILKGNSLVPESFTNEINKNHLPEFEKILEKGYDEATLNEACEFFENHFFQTLCPKSISIILSFTKFKNLVRNFKPQAQLNPDSSEFTPSERVPCLVLGSYGMSINDEIACLQRCIKQINNNMKLNGNHVINTENCWARLLSDVTNRKKFLEHCK